MEETAHSFTPLLTLTEAARALKVSPKTIYRLVSDRRIPHLRIGLRPERGAIRFRPADLASFAESCIIAPIQTAIGEAGRVRNGWV